jgi:hypothetical protein
MRMFRGAKCQIVTKLSSVSKRLIGSKIELNYK